MGIPEAVPARLGRYELVARLATGGMGEIFLARLEGAAGFEKLFVIKRILPHLADDVRFRAMLIAEARIASVMTHANLCQVYELGETEGQLYIVMEYLEGVTALPLLHKMSKEGRPLDLGLVSGVIQQAIDGIHYAHELKDRSGEYLGIVHRDVTPSNIFLTDAGIVKILDFGIAKVKDESVRTQTGTVKGKYAYMAPEQLRGGAVDRRADVFALGIVLFEMLALRRLFQRKTDYLTFRAVMEQPIPDVRHYRPDCPPALAAALARALDRDLSQRFATARQFGSAVLDAISGSQRPWTQGEIGDFVGANFAQDLQKRGAQIATAVGVGGPPPEFPVIVQPDAELDVETDDEFPPVDSTETDGPTASSLAGSSFMAGSLAAGSLAAPPPRGSTGEQRALGEAVTRIESPRNATGPRAVVPQVSDPQPVHSLRPLETASTSAPRGVLWPLVAFTMVAVTGGALVLVWRQMQNQQPTQIVITNGSDSRVAQGGSGEIVVGPKPIEPGGTGSQAAGSGSAADPAPEGSAAPEPPVSVSGTAPAGPRPKPVAPDRRYGAVVRGRQAAADQCTKQHGAPAKGTQLVMVLDPDGHPQRLTIVPESVDTTPLAACIKDAFRTAVFPHGTPNYTLTVNLRAR